MATFDLDFGPETYWPWLPEPALMLARIKGLARRAAARAVLEAGGPAALDPSLFEESLAETERRAVGRLHPSFMGGEYLPDLRELEVEIARIELASTMRDVISVRARPEGAHPAYSVVDEYETAFAFCPDSSSRPLTLGQLVSLIESIRVEEAHHAAYPEGPGLPAGFRQIQSEWDLGEAACFVTVSSELYPQLELYYENDARAWLEHFRIEWGLDDEDEEV